MFLQHSTRQQDEYRVIVNYQIINQLFMNVINKCNVLLLGLLQNTGILHLQVTPVCEVSWYMPLCNTVTKKQSYKQNNICVYKRSNSTGYPIIVYIKYVHQSL